MVLFVGNVGGTLVPKFLERFTAKALPTNDRHSKQ